MLVFVCIFIKLIVIIQKICVRRGVFAVQLNTNPIERN